MTHFNQLTDHNTQQKQQSSKFTMTFEGLDASKCTVLSSLNLSAAFDTVDHTTSIRRLNYLYDVDGTVLQWIGIKQ